VPVPELPAQITVPFIFTVWAHAGEDHDPHLYIVAKDPEGERSGVLESLWHWPDIEGEPFKFQVFVHYLQVTDPLSTATICTEKTSTIGRTEQYRLRSA
jgi:hypothetical protein